MDLKLAIIVALTFSIHLIGTLAYSVRIAGVRTRKIAVSLALFNILVLVSRTSNAFQGPYLAKRVEMNIEGNLTADFRWLLFSATCATIVGALLIPTFQRLFSRAVLHFQVHRSIGRMLLYGFFQGGLAEVKEAATMPAPENITCLKWETEISARVIIMNVVAVALWTVGVFAALYAGYLNPQLRGTANMLSSIVNGVATVLMFVFIDPQLSMMTDDVVEGRTSEPAFRRAVVWLTGSRLAGTLLAQLLLFPAATLIVYVARWL